MSTFVDSLPEVFERFGRIDCKRMFGGHGIYHEGRMFALVAGDVLYLKVDVVSAPEFERLQLRSFEYTRHGETLSMSYREAPVDIFEDRDAAALWALRGYEAALRSGQAPRKKGKPGPTAR